MQKNILLGVSIGESFAEYSLLSDSQPVAHKRVYLSREGLKPSLQAFLNSSDLKVSRAFVSLGFPLTLLNYELSGPAAHFVTQGFSGALELTGHAAHTPREYVFSVPERVSAQGECLMPLNEAELEKLYQEILKLDCRKVCLHFIHSEKNPVNLEKARAFLQERHIQVFIPATDSIISRNWNKNALNATISEFYHERKQDVIDALEGHLSPEETHFLNAACEAAPDSALDSIFASLTALRQHYADDSTDVLYLGLEQFTFISAQEPQPTWYTPWGPIDIPERHSQSLSVQPTQNIEVNALGRFDFGSAKVAWEPGPMLLGRSQKMCLLDIWAENPKLSQLNGFGDKISPQGVSRFKEALKALIKVHSKDMETSTLIKEMQSLSLQKIAMETYLKRKSKNLLVTGPLASLFANAFRKDPHTRVVTDEFADSHSVALIGERLFKRSLS